MLNDRREGFSGAEVQKHIGLRTGRFGVQQIYVGSYIRGYRLMKYIADIKHLSQREKKEIERRLKIIGFFEEYGAKATRQAFEVPMSFDKLVAEEVALSLS
jgi:hypothetical protein